MGEIPALAPLAQRTLDGWHRFVASPDRDLLASLLSEHIVFRSPFVQSMAVSAERRKESGMSDNGMWARASVTASVCDCSTRART